MRHATGEVRLADSDDYERGAEVVIGRRAYLVVGTEPPQLPDASERFVLEPVERP